jgi:hypothetical protein
MRRALVILVAGFLLAPIARTEAPNPVPRPEASAPDRAVQERALIRHCYAQYRGQADIMRCLARGAI